MTTAEIAREIRAIAAAYEMEAGAVVRLVTLAHDIQAEGDAPLGALEEATRDPVVDRIVQKMYGGEDR